MASSDSVMGLPVLALNIAIAIATINGNAANLVNKPSIINILQNSSAKSTNINENLEPTPMKLWNLYCKVEKL